MPKKSSKKKTKLTINPKTPFIITGAVITIVAGAAAIVIPNQQNNNSSFVANDNEITKLDGVDNKDRQIKQKDTQKDSEKQGKEETKNESNNSKNQQKSENRETANNTQNTKDKTPSSSSAKPKNTTKEQTTVDKCKTGITGWDRPASCPTQTRAEYTAAGGWENAVKMEWEHKIPKQEGVEWGASVKHLCYAEFTINFETKTISHIQWNDEPTSTCDKVRNEHPPLPSADYLTNYLRSIAK